MSWPAIKKKGMLSLLLSAIPDIPRMETHHMAYINTPLRYPGGKSSLSRYLGTVIRANGLEGCTYVEPFAGGAGAGIDLLLEGVAGRLCLNDAAPLITAFWVVCLNDTERLLRKIHDVTIDMDEWRKQRNVLNNPRDHGLFERGFAAFFMNRTNRSGILDAGPIGGQNQTGSWKVDARFNRKGLIRRIERIAEKADVIDVHGLDAMAFLSHIVPTLGKKTFIFLDPPYYCKGQMLYLNAYRHEDHVFLSSFLQKMRRTWVMTYDDTSEIRDMYSWCRVESFGLNYFARKAERGREVFISPLRVKLPEGVVTVHYNTGTRGEVQACL